MKIRKFATITVLVLSSFAANNVAPSKPELEAMYDKAFREFDTNNYTEALKDLDAIDARQPDLAESQNLRGVIMMRQMDFRKAEAALQKALAADPKFWNARFNLAEIPFLEKKWPEARKRFQELLNSNASELQGEATQLIQYKILLTYLLEGKQNMVDAMLAKFELSPDSAATQYVNAALALNKKDEGGAKEWLSKAEKSFSPQLNKLFAESLYEVGWLEKPAGQTRAALELNSQATTKQFADAKFEQAEQALAQRDFTAARKLVDEADGADPNQPRTLNLRGEILLDQKDFDGAEAEFRKAIKIDPKFRDAQYNLAQIPFKKKDYAKARDRFESLFAVTTGADKDQAGQLIKFKIFLTLLLEGKDARAQKMMEQFQFTGDTPALYYAQAATEFKNNNTAKANEWVTSARKIYSPALNGVFSDSFYDLGWLQSPASAASPAPIVAEADQPETAPSIEPTPIAGIALAQNTPAATSDPLTLAANSAVPGMEATSSTAAASPGASTAVAATGNNNTAPTAALSPSVETPVASTASPAAAQPVVANAPQAERSPANAPPAAPTAATTPATVLAPAQVRDWSQPSFAEKLANTNVLITAMLLGGILIIAWVVIGELRRRTSSGSAAARVSAASVATFEDAGAADAIEHFVRPTRLAGGPPQISLQLRASEPGLRKAVMPIGKSGRTHGNGVTTAGRVPAEQTDRQPEAAAPRSAESSDEGVGEPVDVTSFAPRTDEAVARKWDPVEESVSEPIPAVIELPAAIVSEATEATTEPFAGTPYEAPATVASDFVAPPVVEEFTAAEPESLVEATPAAEGTPVAEPVEALLAATPEVPPQIEAPAVAQEASAIEAPAAEPRFVAPEPAMPVLAEVEQPAASGVEMDVESAPQELPVSQPAEEAMIPEPIGQGQPIPYQVAAFATEAAIPEAPAEPAKPVEPPVQQSQPGFASRIARLAGIGALRHSVASSAPAPQITTEPQAQQPTTPEIMAQPTPTTPAPVIRTAPPAQGGGAAPQPGAPQPAAPAPAGTAQQMPGGMHTAVQLTFSFEIASLQLTPTFKMSALQLKPTSRVVTMRLAPSQNPQPAMNLQVTFEISNVQLNGNTLGVVRLTPSQQQRPGITSTPSFNIAGLQLVSGADAAPVQLTPAQQGQASVLVTAGFQIATVEFSPSFEIASIILNASSRNVNVQLPGTGPSAVEGAPVFEVSNVQLSGNGEIGMMQLTAPGNAPKRA